MSDPGRVGVIGCGIFGAEVALQAAQAGFRVTVYEARDEILAGASGNNQNRLHLGFHYPRDLETGHQSIRGFHRFVETYRPCIRGGFPNAYFIADHGSLTTPEAYLEFCRQLGVAFQPVRASGFPVGVRNAQAGVLCGEVVYDCGILRELVGARLAASGARVLTGTAVEWIREGGDRYELGLADGSVTLADIVVNCSYADINRLTAQLGHPVAEREFEYTVVPIIRLAIPPVGITIMDGPFMTLLPYGKSGDFLLYAVEDTVVARTVASQMNIDWLAPDRAPFAGMSRSEFFEGMVASCEPFVPALAEARMVGHLEGPRMVLARNSATDARPSVINHHGRGYYTVFSGKIDHCVWVAEEICTRLSL